MPSVFPNLKPEARELDGGIGRGMPLISFAPSLSLL